MRSRKLNLKARAARMEETRQRIIQAAYDLHCTVGPARTTISAIARHAGVQRHTVYQHFPNELELSAACTEHGLARDPQPVPAELAVISDPEERLRTALRLQYGYYRRNEPLLENIQRDQPLMLEQMQAAGVDWSDLPLVVRSFFEQPAALQRTLLSGWPDASASPLLSTALHLALDFATWRTLQRACQLTDDQAIELMVRLVAGAHTE